MYCHNCENVIITLSKLEGFVALYNSKTFGDKFECLEYWKDILESMEGCQEFMIRVSSLYGLLSCYVLDSLNESTFVDIRVNIDEAIFALKVNCLNDRE